MNNDMTKNVAVTVFLILLQVLILNNIHLFGVATPLLYVYIIIRSNANWPRWTLLLVGFFTGLICDTFSNTPGVSAAAMTLVAMIKPAMLKLFSNYEMHENMEPSMRSLGFSKYLSYSTLIVVVYCLAFFTLEEFTVMHWQRWLLCTSGSAILTILFILAIENLRQKK